MATTTAQTGQAKNMNCMIICQLRRHIIAGVFANRRPWLSVLCASRSSAAGSGAQQLPRQPIGRPAVCVTCDSARRPIMFARKA
jgi:hypothetical protein